MAMVIDPAEGKITCARAALPPPIVVDGSTGESRTIEEGGLPLTMNDAAPYKVVEMALAPGDTLILTSDGVTDVTNPHERWVLVSILFDRAIDPNDSDVQALYLALYETVAENFSAR